MKILVTGFDPFGGEEQNPAIEAVNCLPNTIKQASIIKQEVPTVFRKSAKVVADAVEEYQPHYVLFIGQAGGRYGLTPERVAINLDDARIPDNEGNQPIDAVIQEDGEAAYFSQHPVKAIVAAIQNAGIPATVSYSAGTFVCNHLLYQGLYMSKKRYPKTKFGFIHVPYLPSQVVGRSDMPSMSLENIVKGLEIAIETLIVYENKEDIHQIGGTIH